MHPPQTPVCQIVTPRSRATLPSEPGVYALQLTLQNPCQVMLGQRAVSLPAGDYVYVGSACGPGGLRARLGRHLSGAGRPHWHIDALRGHARIVGAYYCVSALRLECRWVQALLALPGVTAPAPGFGASDCRSGCLAHLVLCDAPPSAVQDALEAAVSHTAA